MRQYWRLQQSQAVISMAFWTTTLTLIIWPYVSWRFDDNCDGTLCFSDEILGISSTYFGGAARGARLVGDLLHTQFLHLSV